MNLRQAAQQALEALESDPDAMVEVSECHWDYKRDLAIAALKQALAEPEQEPVAWRLYKDGELYAIKYEKEDRGSHYTWEPLYTAPTPRKPEQDELERKSYAIQRLWKEHDELRALNAELLEALKHAAECVQSNYLPDKMGHDWDDVIAKAEAQK